MSIKSYDSTLVRLGLPAGDRTKIVVSVQSRHITKSVKIKNPSLSALERGHTHEREYFEHLERFLRHIEPIIEDLKGKGFIK